MRAVEEDTPVFGDRVVGARRCAVEGPESAPPGKIRDVDAAGDDRDVAATEEGWTEGCDDDEPDAEGMASREEEEPAAVEDNDLEAAVNRPGTRLRTWSTMSPGTASRRATLYSMKLSPS